MTSLNKLTLGAAGILLLTGCSLAPNDPAPPVNVPPGWSVAGDKTMAFDPARWWTGFNQPQLNALIDEALQYNADLQLAAARVAEARASVAASQAERFPLLEGQAEAGRGTTTTLTGKPDNSFSLGALLSYEIDLWGRLANANEAARARLLATDANRQVVRQAVAAEVARNYFTLQTLDWQVDIAERTIATRQGTVDLQRKRFDGGDIDALDFRQAESELAAAQALLPSLQQQHELTIHALSVLLGHSPEAIIAKAVQNKLGASPLPDVPPLPEILLSDHIVYRPDILAAEENIKAANADIGVARAAYLPRLSLSALLGVGSTDLDTLMQSSAKQWNIAGAALGPILDFGRASAQVEAAQARQKQAYITYEQTARLAVREIMDALTTYARAGERLAAQNKQIEALRSASTVARKRYDAGYSSNLEVLDAERNLLAVEVDSVSTQNERLIALTNLYRALGHGE